MNKIINYIKEKQKEYHEGSPAYNVLRALEVELPSLFEPSEHNPPVDPLSVRADAVYNERAIMSAMKEYGEQSRNEAIQECIQILSDSETKGIALRELEKLKI